MRRPILFAGFIAAAAGQSVALTAETGIYRVDPARSHASIHVGKAGAFSFIAGHTHDVSGPIQTGSIDVDLHTPSRSRVEPLGVRRELRRERDVGAVEGVVRYYNLPGRPNNDPGRNFLTASAVSQANLSQSEDRCP